MNESAFAQWVMALPPDPLNWATFGLMFLEGMGIPGVPGALPMFAQAALITGGRTTFAEAVAWGLSGNLLGSVAGYYFGLYGVRLLPARWQAGIGRRIEGAGTARLMARLGGPLVALSRVIGTLRTPVTLAAGPLRMPFVMYFWYSVLGCALHVVVWQYLLWKFGAAVLRMEITAEEALPVLGVLALLLAGGWFWRRRLGQLREGDSGASAADRTAAVADSPLPEEPGPERR